MNRTLPRLLDYCIYPGLLGLVFLTFLGLEPTGLSLTVRSYAALALGAALVTLLERLRPERASWSGTWKDVRTDVAYLVWVQMLLPHLLGILVGLLLVRWLGGADGFLTGLWPHHWPVTPQIALMLVASELLRYWLHFAAHRYRPLWRLHAVHHAPEKLYWLNVGRFHPLEKCLQYLLDALPFGLIGVGPEVLAAAFVFYAVNGFLQHSNIRLRLGLLNLVVAGPELHRWHHSIKARESRRNLGNNLIVWDLLFGTYFRPTDRTVDRLGIGGQVPETFLAQLKHPFWIQTSRR